MASSFLSYTMIIILLFKFQAQGDFVTTLDSKLRQEKLSHFRFYMHDLHRGSNPTSVTIIKPTVNITAPGATLNPADGFFGTVNVIDNPLTEGPMKSSKLVGRAQGLYAQASQEETGLLMVMNIMFLQGKYNGSSIAVLGRNKVYSEVREMPVVGGSGLFRFARGYVEASTYGVDEAAGGAIVKFKVYVMHY